MKLDVLNKSSTSVSKKEMPKQFNEEIRADLIKRAVLSLQLSRRQPYGADPMAGQKHASNLSRRRHKYKTTYGFGISRVPRKIMSSRGTRHNWVGAIAPGTVGGRRAHPPKAGKDLIVSINDKENQKAIRSALTATLSQIYVNARGHKAPKNYPFLLESSFEDITKTKELMQSLQKLGFNEDLERATSKTRAGKGKLRGRKKIVPKSILIVTSKKSNVHKAASNIPGVDVCEAESLNAELLAPGTQPGRLTIYTEAAVDAIAKENLFNVKAKKEAKPVKKEITEKQKKEIKEVEEKAAELVKKAAAKA